MKARYFRRIAFCGWLMASFCVGPLASAQSGAKDGEWPTYGGDLASTRYAPLDQISATNFGKLQIAWRFGTSNLGPRPEYNLESTPLMVKGVLYSTGGTRKAVVALDAATGELLWTHREEEGPRAAASPQKLSGRGLAYWTDGREQRILYVTIGYRLIALDAKTGAVVPSFGKNGAVDLKQDDDQQMDLITGDVGLHAAPVVAKDVVIIGAAHSNGSAPRSRTNVKGYVRGFDVRTGKRLWIFHTIPKPGEFGFDTWEGDSPQYTGNAGVWGQMSVDEQLGLVFLPVELPTGDYYGGHRPGNGLFGESVVAVDLRTGVRKWHYQLVHHGIWDMDIPCAPMLVDITVDGKPVKALAQPTKQAFLYMFNRETGVPIFPIEERPVGQSAVPGEKTSPTQPFPTKPPAYGRQGMAVDDLIDFTPELRAEALKIVSRYNLGPIFSPPIVSTPGGPLGTLGGLAGSNWPGGSYDPETHIAYLHSSSGGASSQSVVPSDPSITDFAFVRGRASLLKLQQTGNSTSGHELPAGAGGDDEGGGSLRVRGLPLTKPPYGQISAVNLDKGEILWQIAHGDTPDGIKKNAALKGLDIPRTGRAGFIGTLVTKTLLIAGEPGTVTTPSGQVGAMLRAYDKATGKEVGAVYMPAPQTGSPMTYMLNGSQYIVVAVGGIGHPAELLAYKVPR